MKNTQASEKTPNFSESVIEKSNDVSPLTSQNVFFPICSKKGMIDYFEKNPKAIELALIQVSLFSMNIIFIQFFYTSVS